MKRQISIIFPMLILIFIGCSPKYYDQTTGKYLPEYSRFWYLDYHPETYKDSFMLEWNNLTSEKKSIVGRWELPVEGKTVIYHFGSDGNCDWTIGKRTIKGRYEIKEEEKFYRIKMYDFNFDELDEVEFYGVIKLRDDWMIFYGKGVKDLQELSRLPDSFPGESLILKKMKDKKDSQVEGGKDVTLLSDTLVNKIMPNKALHLIRSTPRPS